MLRDIKSMTPAMLEEHFLSIGEKKYRAMQVFTWLHRGVKSFADMTDLPLELRDTLSQQFYISVPVLIKEQCSADGTVKYLWNLTDDAIETVLMDYNHGTTVCISSQAGCRMGCVFCASAIGGFNRNLTTGEMLDQVIFSQIQSGKKISNIVLMGIGEPLDNFDNVIRFIELICHPKGFGIGARHITLSTCGIIENIDRLSDCGVKLSLAISLHAPDDNTRNLLVPYNRQTGVKALIDAAQRYCAKTGRRVSFEYAVIDGINDTREHAEKLAGLLKNTGSHLNLIMLNPIAESNLTAGKKTNLEIFTGILLQNGINFTTRRRLGSDIDASCGQLRRKNPV